MNGQPRTIKILKRTFAGERSSRRKADEENETHIAAPMPGTISSMQVRTGDRVEAGETLLTLEAMKMETAVREPRDGTVSEVLVKASLMPSMREILLSFSRLTVELFLLRSGPIV